MPHLKLASCMAENGEFFCQAVAGYIQNRLSIKTGYINDVPWQERERLFDEGQIQILWLCGLPYVRKADQCRSDMELLAVPVPMGSRYRGNPQYFSDVVVRKTSRFHKFADLRGARWAYNEPQSHSGYNVVRAHLFDIGESNGFFAKVVESGAHRISLGMILSSAIDGAAIDSTVLEWTVAQHPGIGEQVRVIATFGPSPIPPWVITTRVPEAVRKQLRALFLGMSEDPKGRAILEQARMARFTLARDGDYDPIRSMARAAEQVMLEALAS